MKIAIDLIQIPTKLAGVGFYMENLVKNLLAIDRDNEYVLFVRRGTIKYFLVKQRNISYVISPDYPLIIRVIWEQLVLPLRLLLAGCQVLHSPHYTTPLLGWWFKRVVTFPDMTFFLFPEVHVKWKIGYFQKMTRLSARLADKIISISYSTTKDIKKILHVPDRRIATTQLAVAEAYRPITDKVRIGRTLQKYLINGEYLLYVGTLEPRKNITNMVKAYMLLPQKMRDQYKLVITGKKGWHYQELFALIESSADRENIICTGYVAENELPDIFNGARLFVYPSIYEGFGIPVLEAMACGVPVITSNVSSMPEVLGDAGILIDPGKPAEIGAAIEKVLTDNVLSDKMRCEGVKQAQKFSWRKCAAETLAVYEEVAA
jgi:glycosyltransferase involved in cell wall biosynthesis